MRITSISLALALALSACASDTDYAVEQDVTDEPAEPAIPSDDLMADPRLVTAEMLGDDWPLATVEEGELDCVNYREVVIRTEIGTIALNGNARENESFIDLFDRRELWRDDPASEELGLGPDQMKVGASALIDRGLQLCNS